MTGWVGTRLCPAVITSPVFNITTYLADADAGTPSIATPGLQAAFNAVAASGGVLNLTPGLTYLTNATLSLSNKSGFLIDGNGATIKMANGTGQAQSIAFTTCSNWVVKELTVDGNRANRTPAEAYNMHMFRVTSGTGGTIRDCTLQNACADGLYIEAAGDGANQADWTKDFLLFNSTIKNSFRNNHSLINGDNCQYRGSIFRDANGTSPKSGFDVEPNGPTANPGASNILIEGCQFINNGGSGFEISFNTGTPIHAFPGPGTLQGCMFDGNGDGLSIAGAGWRFQNNEFKNQSVCLRDGLVHLGASLQANDNNSIDGNSFNDNSAGKPGIYVHSQSGEGNSATNNQFFNQTGGNVSNNDPTGCTTSNNTTSGIATHPSPAAPTAQDLDFCTVVPGTTPAYIAKLAEVADGDGGTIPSSLTVSVTVSAGSNRSLVACVQTSNATLSSITFDGTAFPAPLHSANGIYHEYLAVLLNPTVKTANVVATFSGPSDSTSRLTVHQVNGTVGVGATGTGAATSATPNKSITTTVANSMVFAGVYHHSPNAFPFTPDAGTTERTDGETGASAFDRGFTDLSKPTTTAGSYNIGTTSNGSVSDEWAICVVELKAAPIDVLVNALGSGLTVLGGLGQPASVIPPLRKHGRPNVKMGLGPGSIS